MMKPFALASLATLPLLLALPLGCGAGSDEPVPVDVSMGAGAGGVLFPGSEAAPVSPNTSSNPGAPAAGTGMPAGFTGTDLGGWKLGEALMDVSAEAPLVTDDSRADGCGSILTGVVRDMQESHPDFGGDVTDLERGLVRDTLGPDGKPVLGPNSDQGFIRDAESFRQWYETVPGVNSAFALSLYLEPNDSKFSFESHDFFPLDRAGFGNQNQDHNFSFTFELHTRFRYDGGEAFEFSGDDDLWVFINGRLAIDLGGVHAAETQDIDLDDAANRLGITPGNEYSLDFFQAERHATQSNFQIDTTLEFTDCGASVLR